MQSFPPTIVIRHRKENLKKCSLRGLEQHKDFRFFSYPKDPLPDLNGYFLLAVGAPPLTAEDKAHGLLLLDGTWRYAEKMIQKVDSHVKLYCARAQIEDLDCAQYNLFLMGTQPVQAMDKGGSHL